MRVTEGVDFGNRRQNGRPFGRLERRWNFAAGSDRGSKWSAAAHEGGAGADRGGEHDAGCDGKPGAVQSQKTAHSTNATQPM